MARTTVNEGAARRPRSGRIAEPAKRRVHAPSHAKSQDLLPDAKRRIPPFRAGFVRRARLVDRLLGACDLPVALIAAPAGYGKTSLLSEWAEQDERPFAWITLDAGDNDPAVLLAAVAQALDEIEPLDRGVFTALSAAQASVSSIVLSRLARSVDSQRGSLVLVLDDVDVVRAPQSLAVMRVLAEHLPAGSQLVLGSRSEPALPIGRLRANRALVELRSQDLAMTRPEAAELLARAGLKLGRQGVETLMRRTEGWPAGLYLAALSLRGQPDLQAGLERFAGDDHVVSDYLRGELLSQLPSASRRFLTRTSVLEHLSGALCDAVLDRRGSALMLRRLADANLLLVPLDSKHECYRCHELLRDMLQAELHRLAPDDEPGLHRRASEWHSQRGDLDRAIQHAVAAADARSAGELLWANVLRYVTSGHNGAIQRWLNNFTAEQVADDAQLALTAAHSHLAAGELDLAEHWAAMASAALGRAPADDRARSLPAGIAIVEAAAARQGVIRMGQDAARAYELEPSDSPWRSLCCLLRGVAYHLTGVRGEAHAQLEEGVHRSAVAAPSIHTLCLSQLAMIAVEERAWDEGAALTTQATEQVTQYGLADYPTSALVFAVSAAVSARTGRIDQAKRDLRRATDLSTQLVDFIPWYEVQTRIMLARAAIGLADLVGARTLLAEASRLARRTADALVFQEWLDDAWKQVDARAETALVGPSSLTTAELRILRFLPTHLSFPEIGTRLHVSANTVKTQAHAVYRKLDASSRSEAVTHALEVGLLDV